MKFEPSDQFGISCDVDMIYMQNVIFSTSPSCSLVAAAWQIFMLTYRPWQIVSRYKNRTAAIPRSSAVCSRCTGHHLLQPPLLLPDRNTLSLKTLNFSSSYATAVSLDFFCSFAQG